MFDSSELCAAIGAHYGLTSRELSGNVVGVPCVADKAL